MSFPAPRVVTCTLAFAPASAQSAVTQAYSRAVPSTTRCRCSELQAAGDNAKPQLKLLVLGAPPQVIGLLAGIFACGRCGKIAAICSLRASTCNVPVNRPVRA